MGKPTIEQLRLVALLKRLLTNVSYVIAWTMFSFFIIVLAIVLSLDVLLPLAGVPILGERPPAMAHPSIQNLVAVLAMLTAVGFTSFHFFNDPRRSQFWLIWLAISVVSMMLMYKL